MAWLGWPGRGGVMEVGVVTEGQHVYHFSRFLVSQNYVSLLLSCSHGGAAEDFSRFSKHSKISRGIDIL